MTNEDGVQIPTTSEGDKTPQENDTPDSDALIKTREAQKEHWRNKAIDPETGRTYKELYEESRNPTDKTVKNETKNIKSTSDELDYGQLAFLTAKGVEDGETEFVQQELRKFGGELKDLWNNEYFQSRLKSHRDTMAAKEATPSSKRATGEAPSSKADYWIARNEMPANTPENQELRREIVNKRMERERNANKFAGQSIISN